MTDEFRDAHDSRDPNSSAHDDTHNDSAITASGVPARDERRAERRRRLRERTFDTTVASPCIAVCQLGADDLCVGCLRTMDEIRDWPILSAEDKRAVLANIEARKTG